MTDIAYNIKERIAKLDDMLEHQLPDIASQLREIHSLLKEDEEVVTLLSPEEINVIIRDLMKQTSTTITASVAKRKTKALKQMTLEDL